MTMDSNYLSNSLLILVFLHSFTAQLTEVSSIEVVQGMRLQEECRKIADTSNCSCSQSFKQINCPGGGVTPHISIERSQADRVRIHCRHLDPIVYRLLPQMTIEKKSIAQIVACPLPLSQSISEIFNKLGITEVTELLFEGTELNRPHRNHFEGLKNLRKLLLMSNDLSYLPVHLFADLGDLTWLDLRSDVVRLPPGILQKQNKLVHLGLRSRNLMHITKETFEGTPSLRELDLRLSNVSLHPDVFSRLANIREINFIGNYFKSLPDGLLSENKNLNVFRLYDNRVPLKTLPEKLLANLPHLHEVRLSCGLETISEDLFFNSRAIRNLTISDNNLTELPLMLFVHKMNLIQLDLSRNHLTSLPEDIFLDTTSLLVLRLSHNNLVDITSGLFSALGNLQMLYLDNNNIFTIHPEAFTNTPKLNYINMENNHVHLLDDGYYEPNDQFELESPFKNLKDLRTLILRNNSIPDIFVDWTFEVTQLRTLDLSYNNIAKMSINYPPQARNYEIFVNLSHNRIERIFIDHVESNSDTQDLRNGHIRLDLSSNLINCDCELLSFVEFLKQKPRATLSDIQFSLNDLQCSQPNTLRGRLVSTLSPVELLCPLGYENSSIQLCPENCTCFERTADQIAIVNCSSSNITEVPILPNLKESKPNIQGIELYIENNRLSRLPDANTPGYTQVVQLHASNNSLTTVEAVNLPQHLNFLDLSHNKILRLNDSVLNTLNDSRTISMLTGNPWVCDCSAQDLLRFVQFNEIIRDRMHIKCVDGKNIHDMSIADICTEPPYLIIAICILIVVGALCAAIVAPLYYKYQQQIKVWLYAHGMCHWLVTEQELDRDKKYDAFISYSHKDEDFITDDLLPQLENGPNPFKLCVHIRDWIVGEFIPYQILQSVEDSRRTIIVLSPNFIESVWARMEFRAAHSAALNEGRFRVIVILYGDIGNIDALDPELKQYLKMNTYVKWGDPWFWQKLRFAMPHPQKSSSVVV